MAMIMFFAFVTNIVLARFTPLKYIFLTGHHTMFMATLVAVILHTAGLSTTTVIISGSLLTGFLMVLMPAIAQPFTCKVTGSNELAMGHFSTLSYIIAGYIGEKWGNKERTTEHLNMPTALLFLRDTPVAISFTMSIFFLVSSLFAGQAYVSQLAQEQNWIVFSLIQSLRFAGGVYIILQGVKMLISEIIPAFKGISQKLVPGAKPALDCPMVFAYAPNAVLFGFISSFLAGIVVMLIQIYFCWTVIVPGVVAHFFLGATSGVYGNATGGFRGAILGSFVQGLIISFLPMLLIPVLGNLGIYSTTFSDMDFAVIGLFLGYIAPFLGGL
ncbi:UNVERIFIED_CONTAM: hypothetical protein PYX00_010972 [Menopon gallinae]|uniref:Ascorbate-specific PTS system EIIC component n=1 Tax=Menopon gallinae TaxID=328185 RepID=A0AAW2H6Q0_9NEOP